MLYPNKTVSVKRWATYGTTVKTWLRAYLYELSDEQVAIHGIEWGQNMMKMLTNYSGIEIGDKITDGDNVVYIVSKVSKRTSSFKNFYEIMLRREND